MLSQRWNSVLYRIVVQFLINRWYSSSWLFFFFSPKKCSPCLRRALFLYALQLSSSIQKFSSVPDGLYRGCPTPPKQNIRTLLIPLLIQCSGSCGLSVSVRFMTNQWLQGSQAKQWGSMERHRTTEPWLAAAVTCQPDVNTTALILDCQWINPAGVLLHFILCNGEMGSPLHMATF